MVMRFIIGVIGSDERPTIVLAQTADAALDIAIRDNGGPSDISSTTAPQAWAEPYTARRAIRVGVTRI